MLKRDKNFRISKQTKRTMATYVDPVARNAYKNSMIEAQLFGSQVFEKKKKRVNETETS
jgi:hypothetical protein